mmetsp:Transcript_82832/g.165327  ORF Transcript_82832/g.165327 Transcript_82832/m.165327 type:complete len:646 (-) Transcript_82832:147-2084(-)
MAAADNDLVKTVRETVDAEGWQFTMLSLSGTDITTDSTGSEMEEAYTGLKDKLLALAASDEQQGAHYTFDEMEEAMLLLERAYVEATVAWIEKTYEKDRNKDRWYYELLSLSGADITRDSDHSQIEEVYEGLKEWFEALSDSDERQAALDWLESAVTEALVALTKKTFVDDKGHLTRDGAITILNLRAPGRFKVDVFSKFWSCDLDDNCWSTDEVRWERWVFDLRADLGKWAEKAGDLKAYIMRDRTYYDRTLHEKLDKTLESGMLAFRNGYLLDLRDAYQPCHRPLHATDYVSTTGVIERDLPPIDQFNAKWTSDQLLNELKEKIGKNFSDEVSEQQTEEHFAWAIMHGKPNDAKFWIELSGPRDGGKTMQLTTLAKCLPGLVRKVNISLFSTAESKKSSGPNEALCELQGVRLPYAEEPSANLELDGGFLKDLCGGVEMSTSKKYGHQIRFETTFHVVLISNNDSALPIKPNDVNTRAKRVGWRMMNRFAPEGDASIDNVTVFAAENGLREEIADKYWISMLRLLHDRYHGVLQNGFNKDATEFAIEFPVDEEVRGMGHWVSKFEIYTPTRGEEGLLISDIYAKLKENLIQTEQQFYVSNFKALLIQKIKAYRAANGITGNGGPRYAPPRNGPNRFFGVRLAQ